MTTPRPIHRLAILNRGEAAMRCIRAIKALRAAEGRPLAALAFYTDVDREAPFVRHADAAYELRSAATPVASHLDHDGLIEALERSEADAVWPGWGFVAEDPTFVERVAELGLVFLGPSAETMRLLGDKIAAKRLAEAAGVPVTPWSGGELADADAAFDAAREIGFPVVLKASGGGGGRGIRMVDDPAQLAEAFRSATSEARTAFGDGRVFLEAKVSGGRHVEVQIAADRHGRVVAVGTRDCSVQRRHQKLLEEAPPPGIEPALLAELKSAAVNLAAKVGYAGVGTAEFLVRGSEFHFLEMNPRLQVEHGITEVITGVDLVQLQIRIARGERLPPELASLSPDRSIEAGASIEARLCAEDPEAGFLPAPGRIARFDPALGPCVRVDTGVVAGTDVPAAFDSLIAKVIVWGDTREEARARLACALADFEIVIEGGATNKGYLMELLETEEFRRGGVDTGWLDRRNATRRERDDYACEALVVAAILAYRSTRETTRINFFADPTNASPANAPASQGQEIDLTYHGKSYRLRVFAVGSWTYRVHLEGRVVSARLAAQRAHGAMVYVGERSWRVLYDETESHVRVELDGRPHRFGLQTAGQVRAGTPSMVIAIHVAPGDRVEAGQAIGVLEAMKIEIGIEAPVSGVVTEVRAMRGQQIAAGEVLLVIEPENDRKGADAAGDRIRFPQAEDPLDLFFAGAGAERRVDLCAADAADDAVRRGAMTALREEIRRLLLGYDANLERGEKLVAILEAPLPEDLSEAFRRELSGMREELVAFADVEQLFIRTPAASLSGADGPSNSARMRMYVRRMNAGGAGVAEEFLDILKRGLSHYGVASLDHGPALERALLRMFASQRSPALRHHLVMALVQRLDALAESGVDLEDAAFGDALVRIAGMRGQVNDALADAAADARYALFDGPAIERRLERSTARLESWLAEAEADVEAAPDPPEGVLLELADAPRGVFDRVGRWLEEPAGPQRAIAVGAYLRRLYSPATPVSHSWRSRGEALLHVLGFADGRTVIGSQAPAGELADAAARLCEVAARRSARSNGGETDALELFVTGVSPDSLGELETSLLAELPAELPARRLTLTIPVWGGADVHRTYEPGPGGVEPRRDLHELHPEAAERIDLGRMCNFELERLPAADGIAAFHGRAKELPEDERVFVLAEVRGRNLDPQQDAALHVPAFERAFYEATRTLRAIVGERDERRRLQWNRIAVFVGPAIELDRDLVDRLARRLGPATRHLGLDRVLVRLNVLDREDRKRPPRPVEIVITDPTGSRMEISWRKPRRAELVPAGAYERKVVEARRRGLVYPYEIIRMLTGSGDTTGGETLATDLSQGTFEEYDLDPSCAAPRALRAAHRPYGQNSAGIVFGVISTPTEKVPEGMQRVLVLSDPTLGMGSLAKAECDRVVAAIDLAEELGLPVEWAPVSSGARIAMDSGTENLDATARVVRRIVTFTQAGGVIHVIVNGVNVGAQSYWNALATMLPHTRGTLIMTPQASMVLTGRAALEASGSVAAEDEVAIGGYERVMGMNGEAQFYAADLADAWRILYQHYRYTYVVPGEAGPRRARSEDALDRSVVDTIPRPEDGAEFERVGDLFDPATNPDRKRPFPMRTVMRAVADLDGGHLERWRAMVGAETAIVWDAHVGGFPVCLIGIESRSITRQGYRPPDGPSDWTGATLFPLSSKKVARALNAASGNRPVVLLANLSGFDGSPESMRKLQLEYGAEIARAVVNFDGPILFTVVGRYHGGAYVVFSKELNESLQANALEGSYASVIGGGPAAAVVFSREVRARAAADPRVTELRGRTDAEAAEEHERVFEQVRLEKQAEVAAEFDAIHSVERAREVGSLDGILPAAELREFVIDQLDVACRKRKPTRSRLTKFTR